MAPPAVSFTALLGLGRRLDGCRVAAIVHRRARGKDVAGEIERLKSGRQGR